MPATTTRKETKLRRIGNSLGATLPKATLDRYRLDEGSRLHIMETDDGILLMPHDADFEETMAAYDVIAKKYRNALRELAK